MNFTRTLLSFNGVPGLLILMMLLACEPEAVDKKSTSLSADKSRTTKGDTGATASDTPRAAFPGYSEDRAPCSHRYPWRNAFFGDLHVHTGLSIDAYQQDVRTMPKDAYDFARGKTIPFHERSVSIDRPLDFAAVTDHAEFLGDLERCTTVEDPMYDSPVCGTVRKGSGAAFQVLEKAFAAEQSGTRAERVTRALKILFLSEDPELNVDLCGADGEACENARYSAWQKIRAAAEHAYDRSSACNFTSFVGYEYSGVKTGSNYHRNIIFRNARVPASPVSYLDAPLDLQLWKALQANCNLAIDGCEFLAIPHNPNLSNGILLTPYYPAVSSEDSESSVARLRQESEPLMEIFQHKGQSECINGLSDVDSEVDELCDFEQVRKIGAATTILESDLLTAECGEDTGFGGMIDTGCVSRNDYLRGALLTGLNEEQRLGVNPLKLGVIASTDTHESTPGAVDEQTWQGHVGREASLSKRLQKKTGLPYRLEGNPGGLAGVWAVENSRDAIFDAMKRRETFGTSGPRIQPRLFAGWSYKEDMCDKDDFIEQAYKSGVAMGADLGVPPHKTARPRFAAAALRDPAGNLLQRLQIIKGWIDVEGKAHVRVIDIAGDRENNAGVNPETGEPTGPGFDSLCTVYVDESFKVDEPAYYYLRVVENPSLRWSQAQCIAMDVQDRPEECMNDAATTIQERAWTSPVWFNPKITGP